MLAYLRFSRRDSRPPGLPQVSFFLFKAKIGQLDYFGQRAWNQTMFERAVKKKRREYKKQGLYKSFEFCDWLDMKRYMSNGKSNFYKNWPLEDLEELRR